MLKVLLTSTALIAMVAAASAADLPRAEPVYTKAPMGKMPIGKGPIGKGPIGKAPIGKGPVVAKY